MGTWGPGIFSSDLAVDIQTEFTDLIAEGLSTDDATAKMVSEYGMQAGEELDDGPVFWLVLAATQWKMGRLEESVKERALRIIENRADLKQWEEEASGETVRQRAMVLGKLKRQLLSPMPTAKAVKKSYVEETEFEVGDVVRYRLPSGKPVLFLVVDHMKSGGGRCPIVEILKASGEKRVWPLFLVRLLGIRRPIGGGPRRMAIARWSKSDYPADRLERVASGVVVLGSPGRGERYLFRWWKHLDGSLASQYGLT